MPNNGSKSLKRVLELKIKALTKEGRETEALTLTLLMENNSRLSALDERTKYPSLIFLLVKRPLSTIPFMLVGFLGFSSLWIGEIRMQMFSLLGLEGDMLLELTPASILLGIIAFSVLGLMANSKYAVR